MSVQNKTTQIMQKKLLLVTSDCYCYCHISTQIPSVQLNKCGPDLELQL